MKYGLLLLTQKKTIKPLFSQRMSRRFLFFSSAVNLAKLLIFWLNKSLFESDFLYENHLVTDIIEIENFKYFFQIIIINCSQLEGMKLTGFFPIFL